MPEPVKEPLVSIVIPVYNAEKYLEESLRSVMRQSYRNLEIICVDDGSSDNSPAILRKWKQYDSRIRILTQENRGAGVARNLGMESAKGEYILFFDADDILRKRMIRVLVKAAKKHDPDIVLYSYYKFSPGKRIRRDFTAMILKVPMFKVMSPTFISDRLYQADHGMPWNKFYKTEFLRKTNIHFQDLKNTNDEFFSRLTTVEAKRIFFLPWLFVGYRVGNKDSLQGRASQNILDCTKALLAIRDELKVRGFYETYSDTYKRLAGYVIMLKLLATENPDAFRILAEEVCNNIIERCEMDEEHIEVPYKDAFRALMEKDIPRVEAEIEIIRNKGKR